MNKYYPPEPEEFCLGSEYYMPITGSFKDVTGRDKIIEEGTMIQLIIKDFQDYERLFQVHYDLDGHITSITPPTDAKMKHLDIKDIEECGFDHIGGKLAAGVYDEFETDYISGHNDDKNLIRLTYDYRTVWLTISLVNKDYNLEDIETVFKGRVKNKHQLKQILKMVI